MIVRVRVAALAVAFLVAAALPTLAQAPQPPQAAAPKPPADPQLVAIARDYARAAELTAGLSRSLPTISEQIVRSVRQKNPTASDDTLRAFSDALFDEFLLKRAGEIETALISALIDIYSKEELTALRTFYSSPVGQSIIKKQSQLGTKLPAALQEWTRRAAPEAIQAAGARLKAAGKELKL